MTSDIPYDSATFDAVLVVDVLEHVDDPSHLIAEIARVLRPGGRFVGFVPIEGESRSLYALFRKLLGDDLYVRTKHHVQAYSYAELARLIETHFEFADVSHAYHALGHLMDAAFLRRQACRGSRTSGGVRTSTMPRRPRRIASSRLR